MPDESHSRAAMAPLQLGSIVRNARNDAKLTQAALGAKVGVTRYTINRIEGGTQQPSRELAVRLAAALDYPELMEFVTYLREDAFGYGDERDFGNQVRDTQLSQILTAPGLARLVFVLADEIDLVALLSSHLLDLPPTVTVVFPTKRRQQELEHGSLAKNRIRKLQPTWDVQGQINDLFKALAPGGKLNPWDNHANEAAIQRPDYELSLYESDQVRQSFVVAGSAEGTICATWPAIPNIDRHDSESIPVIISKDPAFLHHVEDHIFDLLSGQEPLTHLKTVVIAEPDDESAERKPERSRGGKVRHRLSNFYTLGIDTEERFVFEIASNLNPQFRQEHVDCLPEINSCGFAVALVLVCGVFERVGKPLGKRLLLPHDPLTWRYQLFSSHVSDEDLRSQPGSDEVSGVEDPPRSTQRAQQARIAYISKRPDGIVLSTAFRNAAVNGLRDELGISINPGWLEEVELPPELWTVGKAYSDGSVRLPIVPRLYFLDLTKQRGKPNDLQLWSSITADIEQAFASSTGAAAFGWQDLLAEQHLDDFLKLALEKESDWFLSLLQERSVTA